MPRADQIRKLATLRQPWIWLLLVVTGSIGLIAATAWSRTDWVYRLATVQEPALAILFGLLAIRIGGLVMRALLVRELPVIAAEEPHLAHTEGALGLRAPRILTLINLEPGSGATTLSFNLAVSLAVLGGKTGSKATAEPIRPACLLAEGRLTAALGLDPPLLNDQVASGGWQMAAGVADLAVHHPSGCALFGFQPGCQAGAAVGPLLAELIRNYDVVVIDGGIAAERQLTSLAQSSDLVLLIGRAAPASVAALQRWTAWSVGPGLGMTYALIVNRLRAGVRLPLELLSALTPLTLLPEEPQVAEQDMTGLPWSLDQRLAASRRLAAVVRQFLGHEGEGDECAA
jgi:hypothetical protein